MISAMYSFMLKCWRKLALTKFLQLKILRIVNDEFLIGVTGVIFNDKHEVLLVKHTYRRVPWSLPGGFLKGHEHPKKGLEREIFEETNFSVIIEKIIKTKHDQDTAKLDMCYIGTYQEGEFKKSHEVVDYGFFSRDKLPPLIDDQYGQIDLAYRHYQEIHARPIFPRFKSYLTLLKSKVFKNTPKI